MLSCLATAEPRRITNVFTTGVATRWVIAHEKYL